MPHDIINAMRTLREEMRQRLLQAPEYRALETLDRSIEEICAIMREAMAPPAPQAAAQESASVPEQAAVAVAPLAAQPAVSPRYNAIASAFAETLAAKLDQRSGARPPASYPLAARAAG